MLGWQRLVKLTQSVEMRLCEGGGGRLRDCVRYAVLVPVVVYVQCVSSVHISSLYDVYIMSVLGCDKL